MNKVIIRCEPRFYIDTTVEHIELLIELALSHYDFECRQAGARAGFIYGWKNSLAPIEGEPNPTTITATFRELDLCLKILELLGPMDYLKAQMANEMRDFINDALFFANQKVRAIEFENIPTRRKL